MDECWSGSRGTSKSPRGGAPAAVEPSECSHLMLRPRWEGEGYLCEGCQQPFTIEHAEALCGESPNCAPRADT